LWGILKFRRCQQEYCPDGRRLGKFYLMTLGLVITENLINFAISFLFTFLSLFFVSKRGMRLAMSQSRNGVIERIFE
jgi:hypothetical protein